MIPRAMKARLLELAGKFPVVAVTGPRQSGKTTLVRKAFPNLAYVSLESLDVREFAANDPRLFLERHAAPVILDEIQRVPSLLSYIQTLVDESGRSGSYILTGSNNLMLLESVSQTLAGRVALLHLLPFSFRELHAARKSPATLEEALFLGSYPALYDKNLSPAELYDNYVATYVERDVRRVLQVADLDRFQRFLKMCAARCGQLVNLSSLGNDCGINHGTAKSWLSLLETCYIVHRLPPHFANLGKRLMKSPKLYFHDTGLVCHLLGVQKPEDLAVHSMRGFLFENWVLGEMLRERFNNGLRSNLYFWRDHVGHEVDCLIDGGSTTVAVEIKSGRTLAEDQFEGLRYFRKLAGKKCSGASLVYAGSGAQSRGAEKAVDWQGFALQTVRELTR